mmetsp:Transcript_116582/g.376358  ORF Transcript_116582/g.376358 Transcript_116582/m.376358 type:complete len:444 (+) Transcript_116582:52-1383(+)
MRPSPPPLPDSFEREWHIPCLALAIYVAFVPLTILCAVHWAIGGLMWAAGLASALLESVMWVERRIEPIEDTRKLASTPCQFVMRDVAQGVRLLTTTILPILLASFQGASFIVAATQTGHRAEGCSVTQLRQFADAGFSSFSCSDGFIAVDMQLGVPAWSAGTSEGRQLSSLSGATAAALPGARRELLGRPGIGSLDSPDQRARTVGESEGQRFGFVAPVFASTSAFIRGEQPVAWAVKAGSPVKRSVCDDSLGMPGTCGFFALKLQEHWARFLVAPSWFGMSWGFNITHFTVAEMMMGVETLRWKYPKANLTEPGHPIFIVAEDVRQYFGSAYSWLWVVLTLLGVGLLDRLVAVFDKQALAEGATSEYNEMVIQTAFPLPEKARGILEEAGEVWNDNLNTREIETVSSSFHNTLAFTPGSLSARRATPLRDLSMRSVSVGRP